jgi:LPS sulfotransferase NodH
LSDADFDFAPYGGPPLVDYMVCSTGRSGSTLLCALLAHSRVMGVPHEYFHLTEHARPLIERFQLARDGVVEPDSYVAALRRWRTSPNGVFGIKAHFNQAAFMLELGIIQRHFRALKFVHVVRADVVAQAVSFSIADQTGQWSSLGEAAREPVYDARGIDDRLNHVLTQNAAWLRFFAINDIRPLTVCYEDLLGSVDAVCKGVCDFVGVATDHQFTLGTAHIRRQGNDRNLEWCARFHREMRQW